MKHVHPQQQCRVNGNVPFATHLFMNPNLSSPIPASLPGHDHKWYQLQIFISISGKFNMFWLVEMDFLLILEVKVTTVSHGWWSWVVNSESSVVCSRSSGFPTIHVSLSLNAFSCKHFYYKNRWVSGFFLQITGESVIYFCENTVCTWRLKSEDA